jgi:uncharacterized protein (TIGR02271 family)
MKSIIGLFDTFEEASTVVNELVASGFSRDNISVVANDAAGESRTYDDAGEVTDDDINATGAGATTGAVVGGTLGVLAGLGVLGALVIPGIGPIVAAGPLLAGAAGAGVGALAGGLVGALADAGVPEEDAKYYSEGVRRGGTLVMVSAEDNTAQTAADIMNRNNAVDVNERSEDWRNRGWTGYNDNAEHYTSDQIATERSYYNRTDDATQPILDTDTTNTSTTSTTFNTGTSTTLNDMSTTRDTGAIDTLGTDSGEAVIPVVEEELRVGKREVEGGGVRVSSTVVSEPVEEDITLRDEHVSVERRPVDRTATDADFDAFREGTIEMTETSEEVVVDKQARVVEEVIVRKDVDQHTETVRDNVRHTDVQVENLDANTDSYYRTNYDSAYANSGYTYDEVLPAYRYGSTLASNESYRGRNWDEIESDARVDWERDQPGTWDRFKAAVRHAWDDVRGR